MAFGGLCFLSVLYPFYLTSLALIMERRCFVMAVFFSAIVVSPPSSDIPRVGSAALILMGLVAGSVIAHVTESAQRLAHERQQMLYVSAQQARLADSRLNHLLKNKAALVAMHANLALHELEESDRSDGHGDYCRTSLSDL